MAAPLIRSARPEDVPAIVGLVRELARTEGAPERCHLTPAALRSHLFADHPAVFADVAEDPGAGGGVVAVALWVLTFSTWDGAHGIWLEDLCVDAPRRGQGLGRRLLATLAARCTERGYTRLEWNASVGNAPAIGLYESVGAVAKQGSLEYRLDGAALARLASV